MRKKGMILKVLVQLLRWLKIKKYLYKELSVILNSNKS